MKAPHPLILLSVAFAGAMLATSQANDPKPSARKKAQLILNGGVDQNSNHLRYLENVRAMYEAFRSTGSQPSHISVLYGSGNLSDTGVPGSYPAYQPPPGIIGPPYGSPLPGGYALAPTVSDPSEKRTSSGSDTTSLQGGKGSVPPPLSAGTEKSKSIDPVKSADARLSESYVFGDDPKKVDGSASKKSLRDRFRAYAQEMKAGGELTLFITDHGSRGGAGVSEIELWGEKLSTTELSELISQLPPTVNVRVITNICFGGGLADLTSDRVCVFANQSGYSPSFSDSEDLDLYAQNFAEALKQKIDYDRDGKVTYTDAHLFAVSQDRPENRAETSLSRFLRIHKNRITQLQKRKLVDDQNCVVCHSNVDESLKTLNQLVQAFDRIAGNLNFDAEGIPRDRQVYVKGRLQQAYGSLEGMELKKKVEDLGLKRRALQKFIDESAEKWDRMSSEEQFRAKSKANLESQQLRTKLAQIERTQENYEQVSQELDLLRYGDETLFKEYQNIRKCMDYEYLK